MDNNEQREWLTEHIPHRIRAGIARLPVLSQHLGSPAPHESHLPAHDPNIRRRCEKNSINEGRFAATRWLIEFVGLTQDKNGQAIAKVRKANDVLIQDFDGGTPIAPNTPEGRHLASVWKGCTQASSHATDAYNHPDISDGPLNKALEIVLEHLQRTIYATAGLDWKTETLKPD